MCALTQLAELLKKSDGLYLTTPDQEASEHCYEIHVESRLSSLALILSGRLLYNSELDFTVGYNSNHHIYWHPSPSFFTTDKLPVILLYITVVW